MCFRKKDIASEEIGRGGINENDAAIIFNACDCNGNRDGSSINRISNIKEKETIMFNKLIKNQKGVAVVEMLLLLVILVSITLIFKEQLTNLVTNIFDTILESAGEV